MKKPQRDSPCDKKAQKIPQGHNSPYGMGMLNLLEKLVFTHLLANVLVFLKRAESGFTSLTVVKKP